MIELASSVGKF